MRRILLLIPFLIISATCFSQAVLKLSEKEHDFGTFKEEDGKQSYEFTVSNTGKSPLVIQNIIASCGCTQPDWTREPIPPGGTGKIIANYDPRNRPGRFNKTLSVYTNSNPKVTVLVIKGEVIPREKTIEELFTFPVGAVRFESNHLAFTKIKKTEKKIRVMQVINTSDKPVKIGFERVPAHLELKAKPETLKPGQKGIIQGTYDATKNNAWGHVSDMVRIRLNDNPQQNIYYYISANLVEDFSSMTKEDMENAPVFNIHASTVDLGEMPGKTKKEVEFKFTNDGKSDLIIRHIRSTCGCTAVQQGNLGVGIKPGESSSIKAVFNSGGYKGKITKAIYVYTNDPKKSEAVLMLTANVEQESTSQ